MGLATVESAKWGLDSEVVFLGPIEGSRPLPGKALGLNADSRPGVIRSEKNLFPEGQIISCKVVLLPVSTIASTGPNPSECSRNTVG